MATGAVALALLATGTSGTQSSWNAGVVTNSTGTARSAELAFSHAYQATGCSLAARTAATQGCAGSIAPTTGATAAGVAATDLVTNNGTATAAHLQAAVRAPSCGPVKHDNRVAAGNPLLPRHGTTFHTSGGPMDGAGYVTLDGGAGSTPGGYATSVTAATQPGAGLVSAGRLSGVGVWFKAAPGTAGPLVSFTASASNGTGSGDRALYLDAAGKLRLTWNVTGSSIGPTSSSYADNAWHFAYVTFGGVNVVALGVIPQVTLWVDGTQQATTPLISLSPTSSYSGYWHLGWAPTSVTGLATSYLNGSLSNLVIINVGTIPAGSTLGKPTTQAAFNTATSAATDHWVLADPGTTTFTGTLPATMTTPCAKVTVQWTFTNPSGTATATVPLSTFADGTWRSVDAPAPGGTQTSTITVRQGTGYSTDLSGLHLYAPLSYRVQTLPAGSAWSQTFTWAGAAAAFIA